MRNASIKGRSRIIHFSSLKAADHPSPDRLKINTDAPNGGLERDKLSLFGLLVADPFPREVAHSGRTTEKLMTACEKIGLDAINANLFPAGEPGVLSLFTDLVVGHRGEAFGCVPMAYLCGES